LIILVSTIRRISYINFTRKRFLAGAAAADVQILCNEEWDFGPSIKKEASTLKSKFERILCL
jgi:hypothetical protein